MAFVLFTPAFEGDEYHAAGFDCTDEGVFEVDEARAEYLAESFPGRFAHCTVEGKETSEAVVAKMEAETGLKSPKGDAGADASQKQDPEPAQAAKKGKK